MATKIFDMSEWIGKLGMEVNEEQPMRKIELFALVCMHALIPISDEKALADDIAEQAVELACALARQLEEVDDGEA